MNGDKALAALSAWLMIEPSSEPARDGFAAHKPLCKEQHCPCLSLPGLPDPAKELRSGGVEILTPCPAPPGFKNRNEEHQL